MRPFVGAPALIDAAHRQTGTIVLIVANLTVFWYQLTLGAQTEPFFDRWGLVPAELTGVVEILRSDAPVEIVGREPTHIGSLVTPLTAMFIHVGWLHLLGNLLYLWYFGRIVEPALGLAFSFVYLAAGVVAATAHTLATPTSQVPAVGASGAVAGVVGGYLVLRWWSDRRLRLGPGGDPVATLLLGLWVASLALGGVRLFAMVGPLPSTFSWWGHVAGLSAGLFLVSLFRHGGGLIPATRRRWLRM